MRSETVKEKGTANHAPWGTRWMWGQKDGRVLTASDWGEGGGEQAGC